MRGLTARLLIFNILLAVFPIGAVFFLGTYESQLLYSQERAMVQQGRILASALEGHNLEEEATVILERLRSRTDARLRVVDADGRLLADSSRPDEPEDPGELQESDVALADATERPQSPEPVSRDEPAVESRGSEAASDAASVDVPQPGNSGDDTEVAVSDIPIDTGQTGDALTDTSSYPEESVIYRIGALPARTVRRVSGYLRPPDVREPDVEYYSGRGEILDGQEVRAALEGRYGAATRISKGQRSVTLYSAIPVFSGDTVMGAVLVSRSTIAILNNLYQLRRDIALIFIFSVGAAVILSLLLARTVTVPVGRLRDQAESILDERGKLTDSFRPLAGKDEVSDLSRALYHLSTRLQDRTDHMEDFMADLVHEMKNPVAGILSAAELAERSADEETLRFLNVIDREGRRISRLLDDLKELISVDVRLDRGHRESVDVRGILDGIVAGYPHHRRKGVKLVFDDSSDGDINLDMDPDRLAQAVLNLVDNAVSFSPEGETVVLSLESGAGNTVIIEVRDRGPGLTDPEKIFERWYTDRQGDEAADHTGLGLAIVRGIAGGYGGAVEAEGRDDGGSIFRIILPAD